jgi:replicative DNA helicase
MQDDVVQDLKRSLPHDEFSERAILGAMLINNGYANEVFSTINPEDFYSPANQHIAAAVDNLINGGKAADTVTVSGLLKKKGDLKFVGGFEYINSLLDGIPEQISIGEYIKAVKDLAALRRIIVTSMGVIRKGVEQRADSESILNELQEDIIKISESRIRGGFHTATEMVPETMELIENIQKHGASRGLKTGYIELDNMTSGFQKGELIVIAARPSMGKTALALNIALNMAVKEEHSIGFFSIEMSRVSLMMRLLAIKAGLNLRALMSAKPHLSQKEWEKLDLGSAELGRSRLFIDDSPSLSIVEMKTRARRLKNEKGLDIVFVDYLQLMKVTGEMLRRSDTRAQEVAVVTASLKEMAKELDIPVVACAQLNRMPEQRGSREGPRYQLSDLKESGAIEQDADVIMFLHREEQVDRDTSRKGEADVIIAKQRNGPTGKFVLSFIEQFTKFANMEWEYREQ